jgi:hypothetical protein
MPTLPNDGAEPAFRTWFPQDGGYRFEFIAIPPDGASYCRQSDKASWLIATSQTASSRPDVSKFKATR